MYVKFAHKISLCVCMCVYQGCICAGAEGGVGLKSMCELCACICTTAALGRGSVCPILEIFTAYFCCIRKAISPHSKEILKAALCMYKRVCACVQWCIQDVCVCVNAM